MIGGIELETYDFTAKDAAQPRRASQPVKRGLASEQIHDALRKRIVALELAPGQPLSRSEIATYYGMSQTPVRDAMIKLEEEGLLVIFPQSKTEVSRIDIHHAQETQFLRLSIELEVTRRLALAQDTKQLLDARTCYTRQKAALTAKDLEQFSNLDRAFHASLYKAAGVENLWMIVTARSGHIDRLRNLNLPDPGKSSSIMDCHRRILSCIEDGDIDGVQAVVREHLSGTLAQVDRIIQRYPEYF